MNYDYELTPASELRPLPMSESTFYILFALRNGPLHGYGIMKAVKAASSDEVIIGAGTLYGALDNLTRQGLIKPVKTDCTEPRRKYYELTDLGTEKVIWEFHRLERLVSNTRNAFN